MRKIVIWPNRLWVITGTVGSGKTSFLSRWLTGKSAGGFLTPDIDGKRYLLELSTHHVHPFQLDENSDQPSISIGRFRLSMEAFVIGNALIDQAFTSNHPYFIIDEYGKLEAEGLGFGKAIDRLMHTLDTNKEQPLFLIVVRDYLLNDFLKRYSLSEWKE